MTLKIHQFSESAKLSTDFFLQKECFADVKETIFLFLRSPKLKLLEWRCPKSTLTSKLLQIKWYIQWLTSKPSQKHHKSCHLSTELTSFQPFITFIPGSFRSAWTPPPTSPALFLAAFRIPLWWAPSCQMEMKGHTQSTKCHPKWWWIWVSGWTGPPKIDPKTYLLVHSLSDLWKVGISEPVASVQDENSLRRSWRDLIL